MAQLWLARLYEKGLGVPQDDQLAAYWYLRAAENDDDDAQVGLARLYESGRGVHLNAKEAQRWYRRAAELGNETARLHVSQGSRLV